MTALGEVSRDTFSDMGSTPIASTKESCELILLFAAFLSFCEKIAQKVSHYASANKFTPRNTPYRSETRLIKRSILAWDSFRMVSDTSA